MLTYLKYRDFPIHLMVAWWVFWLTASYTSLNEFIPPSRQTLAQFALLIVSFLFGYYTIYSRQRNRLRRANGFHAIPSPARAFAPCSNRLRVILRLAALACAVMLLASLHLAGAFTSGFVEYFAKLHQPGGDEWLLTGIHALDILTKIVAFPLSYTVILVILANGSQHFKFTLLLCIFNLVAFSYLWQVNYPLIHLFWIVLLRWLVQAHQRGSFNMRIAVVMLILFSILLLSATNRYGGDIFGALQRYIVGYHLIGFSFYDHQYLDPKSILHVHSFGRSSLGFLDQILQAVSKMLGLVYNASSLENSAYNIEAVDIGLHEIKMYNAFGTVLFGLYRDFHLPGILVGGFAYGALTTHALYRSVRNWIYGAIFLLLASSWIMGMAVDPMEQPYFWFAILVVGALGLLDRGVRRRRVPNLPIASTNAVLEPPS